jgi:predicted DNA-binding transcriptional regulator AlpA
MVRRQTAADRRALAERRAAKLARTVTAAAKKSRLVPCADDSPYLNSEQAAARIGTTRHGLYNMVRRGHFQAYRRTGARRGVMLFKRVEIDAFLEVLQAKLSKH